jgi:hypothetical protein
MAVQDSATNMKFGQRMPMAVVAAACGLLALAGCRTDPPASESVTTSGGFDSPQAVFEAEKQALANDDTGALFDIYSPDYQNMVVSGVAFGAVAAASATGKQNELNEVFQKHGVDESQIPMGPSSTAPENARQMVEEMEKQQAELLAAIEDKREFFVDILAWLDDLKPRGELEEKQREAQKKAQASARLTNVEITGNTAIANREITTDGTTDNEPAFFVRIDGSWYLHQGSDEDHQKMSRKMSE